MGPFGSHSRILIFIGANTDAVGPFGSHGRALYNYTELWVLLGPTAVLLYLLGPTLTLWVLLGPTVQCSSTLTVL